MPTKQQKRMMRKPRRQSGKTGINAAPARLTQLRSESAPSLARAVSSGFPDRKRLTLKYSDTYEMSSSSGSVVLQQFRANSLFDPDLTGTGHQPRGYDQWCSSTGPYQMYRVLAHRAVVRASCSFNAALEGQIACGYSDLSSVPSLPSSAMTNIGTQAELRGWKAAILPIGSPTQTMAFEARIADIEGVAESSILSEDNYGALYNANPADVAFFSVQANIMAAGSGAIFVQVEHEFDVQFEQPILLASS